MKIGRRPIDVDHRKPKDIIVGHNRWSHDPINFFKNDDIVKDQDEPSKTKSGGVFKNSHRS